MTITKPQARACLAAMQRIAEERRSRPFSGPASAALLELGWMDGDGDYFDYTDGCEHCGSVYQHDQVLTALALCITLSEVNQRRG